MGTRQSFFLRLWPPSPRYRGQRDPNTYGKLPRKRTSCRNEKSFYNFKTKLNELANMNNATTYAQFSFFKKLLLPPTEFFISIHCLLVAIVLYLGSQPHHLHRVIHLKEPIMHLDGVARSRRDRGGERGARSAMAPISGFLCMITSQLVNQ